MKRIIFPIGLQENDKWNDLWRNKWRKTNREITNQSKAWLSACSHEKQQSRGIFKFLVGCGSTAQALVGTQPSLSAWRNVQVCTSTFLDLFK